MALLKIICKAFNFKYKKLVLLVTCNKLLRCADQYSLSRPNLTRHDPIRGSTRPTAISGLPRVLCKRDSGSWLLNCLSSTGMRPDAVLLSIFINVAPPYSTSSSSPTSRNGGMRSQQCFIVHEADKPWHLHSLRMLRISIYKYRYDISINKYRYDIIIYKYRYDISISK